MAAKNDVETIFGKKCQMTAIPWASKILSISLSCTIFEINMLLCFTQKFKMAAKIAAKQFLAKVG